MKVTYYCNSGANIHSTRKETFDTEDDLGYTDEEWANLSEDDKYQLAEEWASERLEIGILEND